MTDQLARFSREYLSKIYGFARMKTNSISDAEDLSQEIALQVLQELRRGKEVEHMGAFVWAVANHTLCNWLRAKKRRRETLYLPESLLSGENVEDDFIMQEQKSLLRRELSLMTGDYRRAVVWHYFDGMTCEEIGGRLGKSAGTVKWWLHDARNNLLEGMNTMKEYGEKSYKPGTLSLSCTGNPGADGEPMRCARSKLAQNILLAAYARPMTVEALCLELGVSAPYVEDELANLLENQLMREEPKGKVQTDFVILNGQNGALADRIYRCCFPAFGEMMLKILEEYRDILMGEKFNLPHWTWERLLWVYLHILTDAVTDRFRDEYTNRVRYADIPLRPNGGKWIALGFETGTFGQQYTDWKSYHPYDGPVHKFLPNDRGFCQGFFHSWSGPDSTSFFDTPGEVFVLCNRIALGEIAPEELSEEEKELFARALEKKLMLPTEEGYGLNYYLIGRSEADMLEEIAEKIYACTKELLLAAHQLVREEYLSGIPTHLHWQMDNFLTNYLGLFVTCTLYDAVHIGKLSLPDENNREWLSLFVVG